MDVPHELIKQLEVLFHYTVYQYWISCTYKWIREARPGRMKREPVWHLSWIALQRDSYREAVKRVKREGERQRMRRQAHD